MLDSATLAVTALIGIVIVIVLQIVLIVQVLNLKKNKKDEAFPERPAAGEQRGDFRRQREQDNRFARKPSHDQKMKPAQAQGQNIDQVERSLRDINLRLKNAEKDQEKERQRIKDTIQSSSPRRFDNQKPRERDDHFRRGDRRHDFQKGRHSNAPHGGREERPASKNGFDNRENRPAPAVQNPSPMAGPAPEAVAPVAEKVSEQVFEAVIPQPESGENLQHGRKFAVRRRVLAVEENQQGTSEPGGAPVSETAADTAPVSSETPQAREEQKPELQAPQQGREESESYASGPISFGR